MKNTREDGGVAMAYLLQGPWMEDFYGGWAAGPKAFFHFFVAATPEKPKTKTTKG